MVLLPHQTEAINPPTRDVVACYGNAFKDDQCVKNQLSFGTLGYCANEAIRLVWFSRAKEVSFSYAISVPYVSVINASQERVFFSENSVYFSPHLNSCAQIIRLENMKSVSLSAMVTEFSVAYPLLHDTEKKELLKQWRHEAAREYVRQSVQEIGWVYFGEHCLLHTVVGDYFRAVGLAPDWHQHDPAYLLRRVVKSMQPNHLFRWNSERTIFAFFLELMLFVPSVQRSLGRDPYRSKLVIRFIAELLQFGFSASTCVPSLVEYWVYQHPWNYEMVMGLRGALSMLELINDPSTWYLGVVNDPRVGMTAERAVHRQLLSPSVGFRLR